MNGKRWNYRLIEKRRAEGWPWRRIALEQGMSPTIGCAPISYTRWLKKKGATHAAT